MSRESTVRVADAGERGRGAASASPTPRPGQRALFALLAGRTDAGLEQLSAEEWVALEQEATRHNLRGLVYRRLADSPSAAVVPAELLARFRAMYVDTAGRNARALHETRRMAQALAGRGIEVILLKGIALARFTYDEPGLRNMADVDVMVRRDRLADAEAVYVANGYGPLPRPDIEEFCRRSNHLAKLVKPGMPVVEVHWGIERPTSPFAIDLDGLWARAISRELDGVPVRALAPEDALLHLAVHLSYHHLFDRAALKGLVDVRELLAKERAHFDWPAMVARAGAWGVSGFVYTTLRLAEDLLEAGVPASVLQALPRSTDDEQAVHIARRLILEPDEALPEAVRDLARTRSPGERWHSLVRHLFLSRAQMARLYGFDERSVLVLAAYPWRLIELAGRGIAWLARALMRREAGRSPIEREHDRQRLEAWSRERSAGSTSASARHE